MKLFDIRFPLAVSDRNVRRFEYLVMLLDDIGDDIVTERAKLKDQHERIAANAAFALEAMENETRIAAKLSAKVDSLTASLILCSQRSSSLKRRAAFIEGTKQKLALLLQRKDRRRWNPGLVDGATLLNVNSQATAGAYRPYAIWRRLRSSVRG